MCETVSGHRGGVLGIRSGCWERSGNTVGASETAICFHKWNQCSARLCQLNKLLAIFNYGNVINSSKVWQFCEAHHKCWTDSSLAHLQGAHTRTFPCIKSRVNIQRRHKFKLCFSILEADTIYLGPKGHCAGRLLGCFDAGRTYSGGCKKEMVHEDSHWSLRSRGCLWLQHGHTMAQRVGVLPTRLWPFSWLLVLWSQASSPDHAGTLGFCVAWPPSGHSTLSLSLQ